MARCQGHGGDTKPYPPFDEEKRYKRITLSISPSNRFVCHSAFLRHFSQVGGLRLSAGGVFTVKMVKTAPSIFALLLSVDASISYGATSIDLGLPARILLLPLCTLL